MVFAEANLDVGHVDHMGKSVVNLGVVSTDPSQYNRLVEISLRYRPKLLV